MAVGAELRQSLGTQNLVGRITLRVLHRTAIAAGEEKHAVCAHHLRQIVVEVAGLLSIVKYKEQRWLTFCCQRAKHHCGTGTQ